jgi:hypothetical protein
MRVLVYLLLSEDLNSLTKKDVIMYLIKNLFLRKKYHRRVLTIILFVSYFAVIVSAADSLKIYQLSNYPVIDGILDAGYGPENPIAVQDTSNDPDLWNGPEDLSGTFRTGWFEDSLYLFIDIMDDIFDTDNLNATWENDGMDIFFDGDNSKVLSSADKINDLHSRIERDDPGPAIDDWTYCGVENLTSDWWDNTSSHFKIAEHETEDGYSMEVAYNIDDLGITGGINDYLGFEIQINDADGSNRETMLRWHSNSNDAWHWMHLLGNATFTDLPALQAGMVVNTEGATEIITNSALLHARLNPNGLNMNVYFEYGETITYGNSIPAVQNSVSGTELFEVNARLTGLTINTTYNYRVVMSNNDYTVYGGNRTFQTYPDKIDLLHTIHFPENLETSEYKPTDYRIAGLPGASGILIKNLFTGTQDKDWQVYWDNGWRSDYLIEYNGEDIFRCIPGRAFWILNTSILQIDRQDIIPVPINNIGETEIELHVRWNLITNPFNIAVAWEKIKEVNQIGENIHIWSYNGSFHPEQVLEPCTGYYFDNNDAINLSSLKIQYIPVNPELAKQSDNDHCLWKVIIALKSGDIIDNSCYFGIKEGAQRGLDMNEYCKPRATGVIPAVYFNRPEWDESYPSFTNDLRPSFRELEEWDFQVTVPEEKSETSFADNSTLSFSGMEGIAQGFSVYLIDNSSGNYINLREEDSYDFTPQEEVSSFTVMVGKDNLIQRKLKILSPRDFSLSQNYPNPFNPVTTILFAVPVKSRVTIKVYNIMGQLVKTLLAETMDSGNYHINWDGKDDRGLKLASGLYIYQLKTGTGRKLTGKMILLK